MARLFLSGWEMQETMDAGSGTANGCWDAANGSNLDATAAAARTGTHGLRINPGVASQSSVDKRYQLDNSGNDCFIRYYLRIVTSVNTQSVLLATFVGVAISYQIRINTNNTLELWNDTAIIGSASAALTANVWYRIEAGLIAATDVVTAYIDGVSFASGTVSAGDDQPGFMRLGLHTINATGEVHFDDVAVNNQTGSAQTSLPGEGNQRVFMPNATGDIRTSSSGGADSGNGWDQVNDKPVNDATDYEIFDVNAEELDVNIEAASGIIPGGSSITLVAVGARHRIDAGTNPFSYQLHIKSQASGTKQNGTATTHNDATWKSLGDAVPRPYSLVSYVDPQAGGSWTIALLDTAHIGSTVSSVPGTEWLTALWAYVEYVEAAPGGFQAAWARDHNELLGGGQAHVH
jgi:hypothetical protein